MKYKRVVLFLLVVVLLVVVSSRVNPEAARREPNDVENTLLNMTTPNPDDLPEETPEPTPEPTPNIREILPGISVFDWELKLVNNVNVLPNTFVPPETVEIEKDGRMVCFDSRAVEPLRDMIADAREEGFSVRISSAYRPYSEQAYTFFGKASQIAWGGEVSYEQAEILARSIVAYPGTSEHQTGLCADLIDSADTEMNAEACENMPLLVWLREHCAEYGFIARYPKNKQEITGWYEPWHFRYVGVEAAEYIMENDLCLEEFIQLFY